MSWSLVISDCYCANYPVCVCVCTFFRFSVQPAFVNLRSSVKCWWNCIELALALNYALSFELLYSTLTNVNMRTQRITRIRQRCRTLLTSNPSWSYCSVCVRICAHIVTILFNAVKLTNYLVSDHNGQADSTWSWASVFQEIPQHCLAIRAQCSERENYPAASTVVTSTPPAFKSRCWFCFCVFNCSKHPPRDHGLN